MLLLLIEVIISEQESSDFLLDEALFCAAMVESISNELFEIHAGHMKRFICLYYIDV